MGLVHFCMAAALVIPITAQAQLQSPGRPPPEMRPGYAAPSSAGSQVRPDFVDRRTSAELRKELVELRTLKDKQDKLIKTLEERVEELEAQLERLQASK